MTFIFIILIMINTFQLHFSIVLIHACVKDRAIFKTNPFFPQHVVNRSLQNNKFETNDLRLHAKSTLGSLPIMISYLVTTRNFDN